MVPSQNLDNINDILSKQNYLQGAELSDLDVIAYIKLQKQEINQYPHLANWHKKTGKQVEKVIKQVEKDFPRAKNEEPVQKTEAKLKVSKKPKDEIDPEYENFIKNLRIKRVGKEYGKNLVPEKGKRNVLITSALPYVNNIPHLGNLIGCVLSGDVFGRYCRLMNYNTIYVCGSDEYGTATEMAARKENMTPREICDKYFKIHDSVYKWFDIDFELFGRTSTEKHHKIAQDIFMDLYDNNLIQQHSMEQSFCEKCDTFLADRYVEGKCPYCAYEKATGDQCDKCQKLLNPQDLLDAKCQICQNSPKIKETKHCYIDLPKIDSSLQAWMKDQQNKGFWTDCAKNVSWEWINRGLKERCITRDLKWGTPVPLKGWEKKVMYVWFDAPIGYVSITANFTDNWEKWWKDPEQVECFQFMAKDNIPFHTIIFPSTQLGTKRNWTKCHHLSATHYLNYEDGKFSKRNGIGVFGDDAEKTNIPVEVWRYYLLINRPENADTVFTWKDFGAKNNGELLPNLGNLCQRALKFSYTKFDKKVPDFTLDQLQESDKEFLKGIYATFQEYISSMEKVEIKKALKTGMDISSLGNLYLQTEAPWKADNERAKVIIAVVLNFLRFLSCVLEPFMPSLSAKINYILGFETRTSQDETLLHYFQSQKADPVKAIMSLVKPQQKLNQPIVLFREFSDEELEGWKNQFAGRVKQV